MPNAGSYLIAIIIFILGIVLVGTIYPLMDDFVTDYFEFNSMMELGARLTLIIFFITIIVVAPVVTVLSDTSGGI